MSTEIIRFDNQQVKGITSLQIAEVTGKNHKEVLRDIRNILERGASERNFALTSYNDKQGKERPMYNLTPKGCLILASGYDVVLREKIIDKLEEYQQKERTTMTALPNFSNPAEAARAWAEQYESRMIEAKRADEAEQQVLQLAAEVERMQPKVSYYDTILNNKSTVLVTQIAQDYGMSAKAFNKTLNELGIQRKVNNQWILYASYLGQGYVQSKPVDITHNDGSKSVKYNTEWTQKGRLFLYDFLKQHDILPAIEKTF
jgi:Rha family phage regulatory protein